MSAVAEYPPAESPQTPRATYRLQFRRHFTLRDAVALVDHFVELGINHVYAYALVQWAYHRRPSLTLKSMCVGGAIYFNRSETLDLGLACQSALS
jgi:hypothetical protein